MGAEGPSIRSPLLCTAPAAAGARGSCPHGGSRVQGCPRPPHAALEPVEPPLGSHHGPTEPPGRPHTAHWGRQWALQGEVCRGWRGGDAESACGAWEKPAGLVTGRNGGFGTV